MSTDVHIPVMAAPILDHLAPALERPGAVYVDCTLGLGGHARMVLERFTQARLVGIDRDADALAVAQERLGPLAERADLVQAVYAELPDALEELGIDSVDAILLDLGLSSLQIDRRERGFAYSVDAPLDMRMDARQELDAAGIVNTYSEQQLSSILSRYGEERFARRIAQRIVKARAEEPFTTSARLVQVISDAIPAAARATGGHPAKRTFQALRIEVNAELVALEAVLPAALEATRLGGRVAVLAYHSLEDRAVKQCFAEAARDHAPVGLPVVPDDLRAQFRLVTRGAERPDEAEVADNPRAASARLRVIERIREAR